MDVSNSSPEDGYDPEPMRVAYEDTSTTIHGCGHPVRRVDTERKN